MANYKLTNDYWETSGVFDVAQNKTQREINSIAVNSQDTTTVSGSIATFNDGVEGVPLKNLTVNIEPVQSGTGDPSPTNVRPITGWTGANIIRAGSNLLNPNDYVLRSGYSVPNVAINGDEIKLTGATSAGRFATFLIPVIKGEKYTYKADSPNTNVYGKVAFTHEKPTSFAEGASSITLTGATVTATDNWMCLEFSLEQSVQELTVKGLRVCHGETFPDYEQYNGNTYNVAFPSEAGTVYGGTLDVTNGKLTVNTARRVYNGTTVKFNLMTDYTTVKFFTDSTFSPPTPATTATSNPPTLWCNMFKVGISGEVNTTLVSGYYFRVYADPSFADVAAFNAFLAENNLEYVYTLITPVEYDLTPTEVKALLGQNNIWADTGDVTVQYGAYLTVIENQLGEKIPKIAVAPIEKTTTASKAYAVNELFFMGDKLYIATTPIASGGTFTVGTNCDETTLGAQITALLNA